MSRDELSPDARAELAALDRILAREPIGEEHLELAALVESVRGQAPRLDPAGAARLEARLGPRLHRNRRARPSIRLALAGGGLAAAAAAVALTIVITSGTLDRAAGSHPRAARPSGAVSATVTGGGAAAFSRAHAPSASAGGAARLVHSSATLELATRAPTLLHVVNRVVVVTEGQGGIVASSATTVIGGAGRARLTLRVPSGHFELLIAGLAALAHVRALTEVTNDVTGGYDRARSALARLRSDRAAASRLLARARSNARARSLRRSIAALDALIAADARRASALDDEARIAALDVAVVAAPNS